MSAPSRTGRVWARLAVGVPLGAGWIGVPACGAIAVWCSAGFTRGVEAERTRVSLLASLLYRSGLKTMSWNVAAAARDASMRNAVVSFGRAGVRN